MEQARIAVVVQARMSSRRFPGKVLSPLRGQPLLRYLLDRLLLAGVSDVVLATSDDPSDDALPAFATRYGDALSVYRGPLADVAGRFAGVCQEYRLAAFCRVSGDSPLLDAQLVKAALALYREGGADLVTNIFPRSFPKGHSVEVVSAPVFLAARSEFDAAAGDTEHVTPWFYRHPERVRIRNFASSGAYDRVSLMVDEPADAAAIELVLARMDRPHWSYGWRELVELYVTVTGR